MLQERARIRFGMRTGAFLKRAGAGPGMSGDYAEGSSTSLASPFSLLQTGLHSWKLTWKPKKGHIKTTVLLKGDYMDFHVSLGECTSFFLRKKLNPEPTALFCKASRTTGTKPHTTPVDCRAGRQFYSCFWSPLCMLPGRTSQARAV